jgi:NitT/TauT family transport system ATP-binding protein
MSAIEVSQRCCASSTAVQFATAGQSARAPLLEVRGVTLQYKTRAYLVTATYRVDFNVLQSDRFVLLGPSGCGKSTLLKAVGGYLRPTEGEILLKGHVVTKSGPDRMMVFQEFDQLLPWKTVLQNVVFPLRSTRKLGRRLAREKALASIEKVNLTKFANSYPHTLSGGMKQRVAIARGMAMEPDILLMDEPFAALDALTRVRMQDELLGLWDETKFTVIFVTHSICAWWSQVRGEDSYPCCISEHSRRLEDRLGVRLAHADRRRGDG